MLNIKKPEHLYSVIGIQQDSLGSAMQNEKTSNEIVDLKGK